MKSTSGNRGLKLWKHVSFEGNYRNVIEERVLISYKTVKSSQRNMPV